MPTAAQQTHAERRKAAEERITELEEQRTKATIDAPQHLDRIEGEIAAERVVIERSELAEAEEERREAQRQEEAEKKARKDAMTLAQRLQAQREEAAAAVDEAARAFIKAAQHWGGIAEAQAEALADAGESAEVVRAAQPKGKWVDAALLAAWSGEELYQVELLRELSKRYTSRPLVASDPKLVEPRRTSESNGLRNPAGRPQSAKRR